MHSIVSYRLFCGQSSFVYVTDGNGNPIYVFVADGVTATVYGDAINAYNGEAMGVSIRMSLSQPSLLRAATSQGAVTAYMKIS